MKECEETEKKKRRKKNRNTVNLNTLKKGEDFARNRIVIKFIDQRT
jgi:sialic acid synthase SpsE